MTAMTWLSANAQGSWPVVINGSLIDWYRQVSDSTGNLVWAQFPPGGDKWMDVYGYEHTTTSNRGMLALAVSPGTPMPLQPTFRIRNTMLTGNCGGIYKGGNEYYSFNGHPVEVYKWYGEETYIDTELEIDVLKWTWDTLDNEGNYTNARYEVLGKIDYQPTDLAYYPEDDIVYGVFKTETGGYRLATRAAHPGL